MKPNETPDNLTQKEIDEPIQSLGEGDETREDPAPPPDIVIEN